VERRALSAERRATLDSRHGFNIGLIAVAILAGLALARLPLRPLVVLVGGTSIVLVTLIEPLAGLALTLIAAPLAAYLNYMTGAVLRPLDIGQVMLLLTFGAWLLRGLARREIRLPVVPLLWPLVLFVGWAAISLLWASSVEDAGLEVIKWAEIVLIMLMVTEAAGKQRLGWVMAGVLVSGTFQAALGIWQYGLRGIGPETFKIGEHLYRAYGSFEQPNPYAGYLGLIWPIAAGLLITQIPNIKYRHSPRVRGISNRRGLLPLASCILLATCVLLLVLALVFSWSRGAWLGALAAMVVMAAALPRRMWLGVGGVAIALAVLISANTIGLLPNAIRSRLTDFTQQAQVFDVRGQGITDANYAVLERLAHWQAAGEMIRYHPWTGVGFSNYESVYSQYALWNWPIALGHAHNIYLNVAAELGMPGLLAYLFLWGAIFWQTARALRRRSGWERGLALGLMGAWTHLSVHHLFDNLYVNNTHLLLGALLGVLTVLNLDKTSEVSGEPEVRTTSEV
jgi:putative inorganic carbon (hco3(-)) transporter